MNARKQEGRSHVAPVDVRRRIVRAINRSAREQAGLPPSPRDPRTKLAKRLQAWRRRVMPLF